MECNLVNLSNNNVGTAQLNPLIFSAKQNLSILHDVVRWQLAKRRVGTHKTKGISDVSGTTAKPYGQKRTGRARQGSLRSPQFRGGGVIFGPVVRGHAYSLNRKVRKFGLKIALSLKYLNNQVIILDNLNVDVKKTSEMCEYIKNFKFSSFLIVGNYGDNLLRAVRNLHYVDLIKPIGLNVFDILNHECVMLTKDTLKHLEGRLL
ncbi:ribosomal protein L4 [Wolbachia endosymbiont of Armadillidium vulgare str. wVulC]|uniref:50S ribosomal protein L4 n=1 Tax=unclassified Wolbachia TaxID=2640676 RepID=UPI00064A5FD2|nr:MULTISPECIES: 50S ribosomal protein L4 [unclassified Wolbachia]OJH30355.1 50S ribosomal protein L4 [Armadillidium vulgare] [Wolbachia endosymbiont of Armadillidium vulgare]KLT23241.1 ribosomal protein L4 [Wolbachia endosymbiont of Armadillidium vulgare str. wVulC]OJH30826.1 50S ribosomal protein L4 [Wolbachia endosymbiont of Armadillidium vulgare]OJH31839.1 50S ribosomal protein L4 [Wolbachia endosymbiont of Armadillidium vulgare]RDD35438.1 50S ribosomal protein L4 [Wolbachia endosymbiont o